MTGILDWIIVGGGPSGLACAIEARKQGFTHLVLEKGVVVNSIFHFPTDMTFFTTSDLLEIGNVPMIISAEKPKRVDALKYYRRVVEHYDLNIREHARVGSVEPHEAGFRVETVSPRGHKEAFLARRVIVATGYYDNPNMLGIPGEGLPKVSHYYSECHPYFQKRVAVIGGKNSAAETALDLHRNAGAQVTLIHRGPAMSKDVKYWVLPDIQNRIEREEIAAHFSSRVLEIREEEIVISTPSGTLTLENDYVLALTGYHPDANLLQGMGVEVDPETFVPRHDPETLETNVRGIFLAGSIASGKMTNRIFIETGRFHGSQIFSHLPGSPAGGSERQPTR